MYNLYRYEDMWLFQGPLRETKQSHVLTTELEIEESDLVV